MLTRCLLCSRTGPVPHCLHARDGAALELPGSALRRYVRLLGSRAPARQVVWAGPGGEPASAAGVGGAVWAGPCEWVGPGGEPASTAGMGGTREWVGPGREPASTAGMGGDPRVSLSPGLTLSDLRPLHPNCTCSPGAQGKCWPPFV